jgi:hypothetical protein
MTHISAKVTTAPRGTVSIDALKRFVGAVVSEPQTRGLVRI